MKKEDFIELLEKAKTDENGRLYLDGQYENKVYFGLVTTVCGDIFDEHGCEDDEIYDRHWWGDDTLDIRIVSKHEFDVNEMVKINKKEIKNYYVIFKQVKEGIGEMVCIVADEDVAIQFCEDVKGYCYMERKVLVGE